MNAPAELCPQCDVAARLVRESRSVALGQRRVDIDDEYFRCPSCAEEFYTPEQASQRHQRSINAARAADSLLLPGQIRAIRDALGLSQRQFERLLGVGEKTCIRWEQGRVAQNIATDRLIRLLAADRANVQRLAAINGVPLPDSCFVPDAKAPAYAGALANWERERPPVELGSFLVMSGTSEQSESAIMEYIENPGRLEHVQIARIGAAAWKKGTMQ